MKSYGAITRITETGENGETSKISFDLIAIALHVKCRMVDNARQKMRRKKKLKIPTLLGQRENCTTKKKNTTKSGTPDSDMVAVWLMWCMVYGVRCI